MIKYTEICREKCPLVEIIKWTLISLAAWLLAYAIL